MAELDPFGAPAGSALGNGVAGEEDPAAAFLAQQESEIAGIENDEAFAILDGGAPGPQPHGEPPGGPGESAGALGAGGVVEKLSPEWLREFPFGPCSPEPQAREDHKAETSPRPSDAEASAREACPVLSIGCRWARRSEKPDRVGLL